MENRSSDKNSVAKSIPASCVKFTEGEYKQISEDSRLSGKSIPSLLKGAYFSGRRVRILMGKEEQEQWILELRRWGNNLNQLARKVNSGILEGWHEEFELVHRSIEKIKQVVVGSYGNSAV